MSYESTVLERIFYILTTCMQSCINNYTKIVFVHVLTFVFICTIVLYTKLHMNTW